MTEMNSQRKRNTEQAAEGYQAQELLWDPVFLFANFSNPIPLSSYFPPYPLCHPNLWPVPSVFQTQTETKGQENPCGTVSRGQPHLGHRVSREERQDLGVVWSMENSQK